MVIGIDLNSRKLAMAKNLNGQLLLHAFAVPKKITDRALICSMLYNHTRTRVMSDDVVYIEAPVVAGARNIQSTIKCAAAYGAVLAAISSVGAVAIETPISLWKLHTVGKGNVSKVDIGNWLHTMHPSVHRECSGDQDLMDASCIALYGQGQERFVDRGHIHNSP